MRATRRLCLSLVFVLSVTNLCVTAKPQRASIVNDPKVRVVGPNGETVPVLNEGGNAKQLKVVDASNAAVSASGWHTDSAGVVTVTSSGMVRPVATGFATVYAETAKGEAKCFVAVMRVTSQSGGKVRGDTKADSSGKVYLSDPDHHVIVRASGTSVGPWVGSTGHPGFHDDQGTAAQFNEPTGLGVDLSAQGGIYVADTLNHCIRKVGFDGRVGTQQKSSVVVGQPEKAGTMTGNTQFPFEGFRLNGPQGVVSVGGNLYITDTENHCIWYADVARGKVYLVAGQPGQPGRSDGVGSAARFNRPTGLAINSKGTLLAVADMGNNVVRLVRLQASADGTGVVGQVSTLGVASSGKWADAEKTASLDDARDAIAFTAPRSVSIDSVENVYVIDAETASVVTRPEEAMPDVVALAAEGSLGQAVSLTIKGTDALVLNAAAPSESQAVLQVTIAPPVITSVTPAVTSLAGGEEVVVDGKNFAPESEVTVGGSVVTDFEVESATRIRLVTPGQSAPGVRTVTVATRGGLGQSALEVRARGLGDLAAGEITTVAGGIAYIGDGGLAASASVLPGGVAVDASGNLYIADYYSNRIRRVDATGRITTVAGTGESGYDGDNKPATSAQLNRPLGVAVDASGNLYIADTDNLRIRRVDATGRITTVAGTGERGYDGDDKPATSARLNRPPGVAVDASGNLYIADYFNNRIRRVDTTGQITTVAGTGEAGYDGDDKPATSAQLNGPFGVAVDGSGTLYIADYVNSRIRRVDASGRITTVAGTGESGYDGDDKPATSAQLANPNGVAVDGSGTLYIADTYNNRIRRVDASGRITTVAGTVVGGYDGDDKPATSARLNTPSGVAVDAAGNLFIADSYNNRIRRVDASGQITTVAGTVVGGYDGDDKPATSARLNTPSGVAVDASGNLFIADSYNHRIRRVDASGRITTVAGTGESGYNGDDKPATSARLNISYGVAVDASGNLFIADIFNNAIRAVKLQEAGGTNGGPHVDAATFSSAKNKLKIAGSGFGASGASVTINGVDVSAAIRRDEDTRLVLKGSTAQLGLHAGANQIVVTVGGKASNIYTLTL
jgi:sugar lactone lactonase YvrE